MPIWSLTSLFSWDVVLNYHNEVYISISGDGPGVIFSGFILICFFRMDSWGECFYFNVGR